MRILVCGGRDYGEHYEERLNIRRVLNQYADEEVTIIEGGARGADTEARIWAGMFNKPCLHFPAGWKEHGKAAGPIRNQQMLDEGKPDLVIAFPGGRGTADMISRAKKAGVKVIEIGQ